MEKEKIKIKEIIVVEGRDDVTAVKRVVDAQIVQLNGFSGLTVKSIEKLKALAERNDLILLTDPDYAGKKIRAVIEKNIPNIKHAFVSRKNATKKNNVGVENASDDAIREALSHILVSGNSDKKENSIFTMEDLVENGLCIGKSAKEKRLMLGDMLNIGYYNSKQLLNALNSFNITRNEFEEAMKLIKEK